MSKIIFLGTAGDSLVMGKQIRASGGIFVSYDDVSILLNPGPGALVRARQFEVSLRELDAVVVSQAGVLHANDVNAVIEAMTNKGLDNKGVFIAPTSASHMISDVHRNYLEKAITINPGDRVALNEMELFPINVSDEKKVGYRLSTPKFCIGFVGDCGFEKRISKEFEKCDIMIFSIPKITGEFNADKIGHIVQYAAQCEPSIIILTDFGIKANDTQILEYVRGVQRQTKIHAVAAKDGMTINPEDYSSKVRQKKLKVD